MPKVLKIPVSARWARPIYSVPGHKSLSLFGSVLKGTAGPDSDIDLLVEFLPDARPTFLELSAIEIELSGMLGGRKLDVRTDEDLSVYFRADVVRMAEPQYVAR